MDKEYLKRNTDLSEKEIRIIEDLDRTISSFSRLTQSDIFIDCFISDKEGFVVSHGRPHKSLYRRNIEGEKVLSKNEPTVFYTKETGVGMSDAFAVSQENAMVQQRTTPIYGDRERIIAVMIQESDVTDKARLNDKLSHMADVTEKLASTGLVNEGVTDINSETGENNILLHETHHRIKNNLQTISSILSIQRRRTQNTETKDVLADNISRINALAAMHEIMMTSNTDDIEICDALSRQVELFASIHGGMERKINYDFDGMKTMIPFEKAQAVSMIVNELMVNAIKHGFRDRQSGTVRVRVLAGESQATIVVFNDGEEYRENSHEKRKGDTGLGLDIVQGLTRDKLKGSYSMTSNSQGTTVMISFPV